MRILSLTHSYGADGAAIMLNKTIHYWVNELGWTVDAAVNDAMEFLYQAEFKANGIKPVKNVDLQNYDVVLINTLIDAPQIDRLNASIPAVLWVHEGETLLDNLTMTAGDLTRLFAKFNLIIFQTDWQKHEVFHSFIYRLEKNKVVVIPNGISPNHLAAKEMQIDAKRPIFRVINVGSVYARKRQIDLAKVIEKIAQDTAISCKFIGDLQHANTFGPEFIGYMNQKLSCHEWAGTVPHEQINAELSNADLFCFPSGDESFPLAPLEAANLKIPVVMADLAPYRHIGWQHEVNCLLYPVGNLAELEKAIRRVQNDPELASKLALGGFELAQSLPFAVYLIRITQAIEAFKKA